MDVRPTIADLRQMLAARLPPPGWNRKLLPTGIPGVDALLGGGLAEGTFTEIVSASPSAGGQLLTEALIQAMRSAQKRIALLDAADAFSPDSHPDLPLDHLVWFRGTGNLKLFWQAADLVCRDAHFSVVVMDLRALPEREVCRTPSATWYRLQRAIEESAAAVVVHTETALVPCAARRLVLSAPLTIAAFQVERAGLPSTLQIELVRDRSHGRQAG